MAREIPIVAVEAWYNAAEAQATGRVRASCTCPSEFRGLMRTPGGSRSHQTWRRSRGHLRAIDFAQLTAESGMG